MPDINSPEDLRAASNDAFHKIANDDLRALPGKVGPSDARLFAMLRHPKVLERWYFWLRRSQKSIETQLGAKTEEKKVQMVYLQSRTYLGNLMELQKKEFDRDITEAEAAVMAKENLHRAAAEFATWRAGAIRFKNGVEERLLEANWLRRELLPDLLERTALEERDLVRDALRDTRRELDRLRDAIRQHREHECGPDCEDDCAGDGELWELVS